MKKEKYSFNWESIKKIHFLNKLMISNWKSQLGMLTLLSLSFLNEFFIYEIGKQSSNFYSIIGNKELEAFYYLIGKLLLLVLMESLILSILNYIGGILAIWWRQKLTEKAHLIYLDAHNKTYYRISKISTEIDNPDQRIARDIEQFSVNISQIFLKSIIIPFIIVYYTYQMSVLIGIIAPCIVYLYFFIGSFANKLLMNPLVNLIYQQEKFEGDFRAQHLNLRSNCEEVALLNGEYTELQYLNEKFSTLQNNKTTIVKKQFFLDCSTNVFAYVGSIVSYVIIGVAILKLGLFDNITNQAELGTKISLSSFYTLMLIYNFSQLIELSTLLSDLAGFTSRVFQIFHRQEEAPHNTDGIEESEEDCLSFQKVSFSDIKKDHPIVKELSFKIEKGNNMLIIGRSGIGKSSILRVISKLWPIEEGKITINKNFFFLPQNPYLFSGSLFSQISYPLIQEDDDYDIFCELLKQVKLDYLLKRFNSEEVLNWPLILSPGEQQKLCLARLLYHKPSFAVLDEATSSLGLDDEELFYQLCKENNITLISIGHRPTLMKFHQFLLVLKEKAQWEFSEIDENHLKQNNFLHFL